MGSMERNVSGLIIYKSGSASYSIIDCRECPFEPVAEIARTVNIWQNIGQLKIWFLAKGWL